MIGSELRNERSQSKEKPRRSSCAVMWPAQRLTHSLGDSPLGDRAQLGGQTEGVEAEGEQHRIARARGEKRA